MKLRRGDKQAGRQAAKANLKTQISVCLRACVHVVVVVGGGAGQVEHNLFNNDDDIQL